MYELKKKIGKVFTSTFVGTRPSSYKKKNLHGCGLTKVEKHWSIVSVCYWRWEAGITNSLVSASRHTDGCTAQSANTAMTVTNELKRQAIEN